MNKTISDFLNTENKDYAMYVIERRAIPSVIDSFKITQRKVQDAAFNIWKNNSKSLKIFQLAGNVASTKNYHHGNCLDYDTLINCYGFKIKIGEWFDNYNKMTFAVECKDDNGFLSTSKGHSVRVGSFELEEIEIELENGEIFKCTKNHPFLVDGKWILAEDLKENDNIDNF